MGVEYMSTVTPPRVRRGVTSTTPEDETWDALREVRVAGLDPIPSFDELFETLPESRFNIDLKVPQAIEPLIQALDVHHAHDRVCVGSFSSARIRAFRSIRVWPKWWNCAVSADWK